MGDEAIACVCLGGWGGEEEEEGEGGRGDAEVVGGGEEGEDHVTLIAA